MFSKDYLTSMTNTLLIILLGTLGASPAPAADTSGSQDRMTVTGYTWQDVSEWPDFSGNWIGEQPGVGVEGMPVTSAFRERNAAAEQAVLRGRGSCEPMGVITHSGSTFVFSKDVIVIASEETYYNVWRRIYMDGRGHPDDLEPSYFGHSVGHWEGETLVVDTIGIRREAKMGITTPVGNFNTRIQERFSLLDENTLEVKRTVTNPEILVEAWESRHILERTDEDFYEAYCWTDRDEMAGGDLSPK